MELTESPSGKSIRSQSILLGLPGVLDALGETVDDQTPILGTAATSHEAGIHTAAMLSEPSVMEAFDPAMFGGERVLLFGPQTGRRGSKRLLERAGRESTDELIGTFLERSAEEGPLDQSEAVDVARML